MMYRINTIINGQPIGVTCSEATARVLLPIWSRWSPHFTECYDLITDEVIVSFSPRQQEGRA